jgi:hypothetical protein
MGMQTVNLVGLRVSVPPQYTPGYEKNGQTISPCLRVRAYLNDKNDKSTIYDLRLWGKLADVGAKSLSIGKEFHCTARVDSYQGRVWKDKGNELVLNSDGSPCLTLKHSFVVEKIRFGAESEKFITEEIANGKRPANWNDGGEGAKAWRATLKARMAMTTFYEKDGKTYYGHAIVRKNGEVHGVQAGQTLQNQVANAANNPNVQQAFGGAQAVASGNPF